MILRCEPGVASQEFHVIRRPKDFVGATGDQNRVSVMVRPQPCFDGVWGYLGEHEPLTGPAGFADVSCTTNANHAACSLCGSTSVFARWYRWVFRKRLGDFVARFRLCAKEGSEHLLGKRATHPPGERDEGSLSSKNARAVWGHDR